MATTPYFTTGTGPTTLSEVVPLPTPWTSAGAACHSMVYRQEFAQSYIGWDPWFATYVDSAYSTCWPPEATAWWNQQDEATTTVLGPTFACPAAYATVWTSVVDTSTQHVFCCPSGYSSYRLQLDHPTFPSQCVSSLTAGDTMSFATVLSVSGGAVVSTTSTTVESVIIVVYGVPINGFNIVEGSSTVATSSGRGTWGAPAGTTTPASSAPTLSASAVTSTIKEEDSSSSGGSHTVAIAVGVSVGLGFGSLLALGAFLMWRKRRRPGGTTVVQKPSTGPESYQALQAHSPGFAAVEMNTPYAGTEMPGSQGGAEMSGSPAGVDMSAQQASWRPVELGDGRSLYR